MPSSLGPEDKAESAAAGPTGGARPRLHLSRRGGSPGGGARARLPGAGERGGGGRAPLEPPGCGFQDADLPGGAGRARGVRVSAENPAPAPTRPRAAEGERGPGRRSRPVGQRPGAARGAEARGDSPRKSPPLYRLLWGPTPGTVSAAPRALRAFRP